MKSFLSLKMCFDISYMYIYNVYNVILFILYSYIYTFIYIKLEFFVVTN